jgi:hypothetical protein
MEGVSGIRQAQTMREKRRVLQIAAEAATSGQWTI